MHLVPFLIGLETGIALGAVYALVALSFTLVYAASGYLHFALGTFVMLGSVGAYEASTHHIPIALGVGAVIIGGIVVGLFSWAIAVKGAARNSTKMADSVLLATMGLAFAITAIVAANFGSITQVVTPYLPNRSIFLGSVPIVPLFIFVTVVALVAAVVLHFILQHTHVGVVLRACQESQEKTALLGINVGRVVLVVFGIAGGLAALSGFLVAPISGASAYSGTSLFVYGAAAMVIGGFGNFAGAAIGGLVIGMATGLAPAYLPASTTDLLILGAMAALLLMRPSGLMGARSARSF